MNDKPGRNDLCYCGSGQKYKKCHMKADKEKERQKRNYLMAHRYLRRDVLRFAQDDRFHNSLATAMPHFWQGHYTLDNAEEMSDVESFIFFDWFSFDYHTDEQPRILNTYAAERRDDLAAEQQDILDKWLAAGPVGGYLLTDYEGQTLQLENFFTGETVEVFEPAGHGTIEIGDIIIARPVETLERHEFSTEVAYIPQAEIADLKDKLTAAQASDAQAYPDATTADFLRRHSYLIVHHALEQAQVHGRPPVDRLDPDRADKMTQKAVRKIRRFVK